MQTKHSEILSRYCLQYDISSIVFRNFHESDQLEAIEDIFSILKQYHSSPHDCDDDDEEGEDYGQED